MAGWGQIFFASIFRRGFWIKYDLVFVVIWLTVLWLFFSAAKLVYYLKNFATGVSALALLEMGQTCSMIVLAANEL